MSNQIKLTIDISEELLGKLLTVIALSSTSLPPSMGGMLVRQAAPPEDKSSSMGFQPPTKENTP